MYMSAPFGYPPNVFEDGNPLASVVAMGGSRRRRRRKHRRRRRHRTRKSRQHRRRRKRTRRLRGHRRSRRRRSHRRRPSISIACPFNVNRVKARALCVVKRYSSVNIVPIIFAIGAKISNLKGDIKNALSVMDPVR